MPHNFFEKRKHPRLIKSLPLRIKEAQADIITETTNISASGAYCKVNRFIPPLSKLKLTLLLPSVDKNDKSDYKVDCEGVVVRTIKSSESDKNYYVAIFFNNLANQDSIAIANYVNWHLRGQKN